MADEAASAPETERVESNVLYIRDRVLEWQDGLIQLRHIQSISCESCDPPPRPDGADKKLRTWKKLNLLGILFLLTAFAVLAASFALRSRLEQGGMKLSAEAFLLTLGAGAYLLYTSHSKCAEAKAEIGKWKADCAEAAQRRRMVIHLSPGRTVSLPVCSANLMGQILQALSEKLQHPEDTGSQYKAEMDSGRFYRLKHGRERR